MQKADRRLVSHTNKQKARWAESFEQLNKADLPIEQLLRIAEIDPPIVKAPPFN